MILTGMLSVYSLSWQWKSGPSQTGVDDEINITQADVETLNWLLVSSVMHNFLIFGSLHVGCITVVSGQNI